MKKYLQICFTLVFVFIAVNNIQSQDWRKVASKTYPGISGIFFADENNGWAVGSSGYVYKTTDAGDNWTVSFDDADSISYLEVYFVNLNVGFAGGSFGTVVKTTNGGTDWVKLNPTGASGDIKALYANSENEIWALATVGSVSKVYYTTNSGDNWQEVLTTDASANDMHFSNGAGIVVGKNNGELYYTSNGTQWTKAASAPLGGFTYTRSDIRGVYMANAQVGYAVGWGSLIGMQPSIEIKTTDGGVTWTYLTQAEENRGYDNLYSVYFKDVDNGIAVGGGGRGSLVIRTTDGGASWVPIYIPCGASLSTVTGVGNSVWVCASGGAILRTTDFGDNWTLLTPIPTSTLYSIQCLPNGDVVAGGYDGLFLKSTNSGQDWKASYINVNLVCPNIQDIFFVNDNVGFAARGYGMLNKTTDGGETWTAVIPDTINVSSVIYGIYFLDENLGFAVGKLATNTDMIYKTTNGGETWDLKTNIINGTLRHIVFRNENVGVAVGDKLNAIYTTDGGTTWNPSTFTSVPSGFESAGIKRVEFVDDNNVIAIGDAMILSSTDAGVNWNFVNVPNLVEGLGGLSFEGTTGWATGYKSSSPRSLGVYQTTDGGVNWANIIDVSGNVFNVNSDYLYNGSNHGNYVWVCGASSNIFTNEPFTDVKNEKPVSPNEFYLSQNYPNPFNPETKFTYNLPEASFVSIKIYDVLGNEVRTLVNEYKSSGKYDLIFNANDLSSGIYFYCLRTGNNFITKKMTLLK